MHYKQCRTDLNRFQCPKAPCSMVWRGFLVSAVNSGEACCYASSGKATGTCYKQCRAPNLRAVSQQAPAGGRAEVIFAISSDAYEQVSRRTVMCISSEGLHFHKIIFGRCRPSWYLCRVAGGDGNALPLTASLLFECNAVHYANGNGVALDVCREGFVACDHHDAG